MEKREVRQFKIYSPYNNNSFLDTVYPSTEGITIIGTNITVRKKAETELERANQDVYKRQVINNSNLHITCFIIRIPHCTNIN